MFDRSINHTGVFYFIQYIFTHPITDIEFILRDTTSSNNHYVFKEMRFWRKIINDREGTIEADFIPTKILAIMGGNTGIIEH